MNRRSLLQFGVAASTLLGLRGVRAQPQATRGAVVIGVNKTGGAPVLNAAVSGATSVGDWLRGEGFEVKQFTDEQAPVTAAQLKAAIREFVDRGTLDQLVVYFAGHGFVSNSLSEFWMLSGAPDDADEAVSVLESKVLAREAGIPNVVLISDACRSRADSLSATRVDGSIIFPNRGGGAVQRPDVDVFLATGIGDSAWEVAVADSTRSHTGVFTACFLDAFKRPYADMVQRIEERDVIPNRRLKRYLAREVPRRAQAASLTLVQNPDSEITSDEPTYIGRVLGNDRSSETATPVATRVEAAGEALRRSGFEFASASSVPEGTAWRLAKRMGFDETPVSELYRWPELRDDIPHEGAIVIGEALESVATTPRIEASVRQLSAGLPLAAIAVDFRGEHAASLALRLKGGKGTVIALLRTYLATVVVKEGQVASVAYEPAYWRANAGDEQSTRLARVREAVAVAMRNGVFRIEGPSEERNRQAALLANQIRVMKGIDPTLGLYAAYAYAIAGLRSQVDSVRDYMRSDLNVDLFDVAMLSGALDDRPTLDPPVPFCPMLAQGWGLLRALNVRLHDVARQAAAHVQRSLWTTFDPAGTEMIIRSLRQGDVR